MKRVVAIILFVLLADQALKVWVKLTFTIGQHVPEDPNGWYYLHFIENEGMAFGMKVGGEYGKLALTWLRIIAVVAIGFALRRMVAHHASRLQVVSVALVLAGALGNIIDSTFYRMLFSASTPYEVAKLLPAEGGYAGLFHGAVVDMFHFPVWRGNLPAWMPWVGGDYFEFFQLRSSTSLMPPSRLASRSSSSPSVASSTCARSNPSLRAPVRRSPSPNRASGAEQPIQDFSCRWPRCARAPTRQSRGSAASDAACQPD